MKYVTFLLVLTLYAACTGCDGGSSGGSSTYTSRSSSSDVMSDSHRSNVVDHMVGQGASRSDADAFTKALNEAQRDYEANK
jgi:hypothetical protein